ncbi:uncharacterized protein LOC143369394 [Andrena cerasifolii]|uniref:uncharacterized protein LOC143369394 n=1 Tax=Andrena cerasifolii TaxID=2819439 RepID=UPI004037637E
MHTMSALRIDGQSAIFAEDNEDVHDCEQSSDAGSASNSDAEPEEQDSESDEDHPSASIHPGNQMVAGRHWSYIAPENSAVEYLQRKCSTMDECFHLFINEEFVHAVILYTTMKANKSMPPNKSWKPVDRTEMDAFFGLLPLIGRFRESRERKQDLWKTSDALSRQFYTATMSRDRFIDILRYIRFDDSTTREERNATDKLAPERCYKYLYQKL